MLLIVQKQLFLLEMIIGIGSLGCVLWLDSRALCKQNFLKSFPSLKKIPFCSNERSLKGGPLRLWIVRLLLFFCDNAVFCDSTEALWWRFLVPYDSSIWTVASFSQRLTEFCIPKVIHFPGVMNAICSVSKKKKKVYLFFKD